jgi:selenophosphate synthase
MARASSARFVFEAAALPALPGALELARAGVETGGAAHNRRFVAPSLTVAGGIAPERVTLAHDPQTSGGLLAAVPPDRREAVDVCLGRCLLRIGRGRGERCTKITGRRRTRGTACPL